MGYDTLYRGWTYTILHEKVKGGDSLIKCNNKYYIGNLNTFKEQKRNEVEFSLKQTIQSLSNPDCYRAHINDTNGRLDSTLTNLWDGFKQQILHDNDCCEIDIVCSQMAFLAKKFRQESCFKVSPDMARFTYLAEDGIIYESLGKEFKVDRNGAKQILFHVLFSHYKTNDHSIQVFKQSFPITYEYIREWKKANGSNHFSIMLQRMESEIMISCVLKELMDRGIFCLTVHDSIICRKRQVKEVMDIMYSIFKKHNFKCVLFSKYYIMEKEAWSARPKAEFYPTKEKNP